MLVSMPLWAGTQMAVNPVLEKERDILSANVEREPKSAEAHFELAMNYAYTGWIEDGWAQLKIVNELDAKYANTVVKKYKHKNRVEPKNWKHPFKLAFGYYFLGEKDNAIASFKKVIELEEHNAWARGLIGLILSEKGEYQSAYVWVRDAIKLEPNGASLHFLMAELHRKNNNYFGSLAEMMIVLHLKSQEARYRPERPLQNEDEDNYY